MIDTNILAIISGSFAIGAILLKSSVNCICPSQIDNDGNIVRRKCYTTCKCCCNKKRTEEAAPIFVLNDYYEPHNHSGQMTHTSLNDDNSLFVSIPPFLKMHDKDSSSKYIANGSVTIFKTFRNKPAEGKYKIEMYLKNVTPGKVRLFIKRFNSENGLKFPNSHPVEFQMAINGHNVFEVPSLMENLDVTLEQVGLMVDSNNSVDDHSTCTIEHVYIN